MQSKLGIAALLICGVTAFPSSSLADNPIVQTIYTADPAPMVHNGTVYLYTGHDEDSATDWFGMNEWRVYSSTDIVNWTDHGSPLRYSDFSWSKGDAWAGQAIHRNGKFYFYVPTTSRSLGRMTIGVAVSDSPTGPFEDALGRPLITANCGDIDPTPFIDDDGQAYLYWGNPNLCYVKLNEDMTSYQGDVVRVPMTAESFGRRDGNAQRPTLYEEGPWLYKRDGLYYLVYAAGGIPEYIAYSTSSSPTGPWTYRGVIMPTEGGSFTNHAGVIDFKGSSYFFYHNGALPGGHGFHRSAAVEGFTFNADGTFPTITMTDAGPPGAGNLNPYVMTEAETIAWESGVETEACSEGGINVTSIENGDYIKVKGVDFGTGAVSFDARVASATGGGSIELRLDGPTGTLVGTCTVRGTGGPQAWVTTSCEVDGATGIHDLYLKFAGGGGSLFNFNWWKFAPLDAPDPEPTSGSSTSVGSGGATGSGGSGGGGSDGGAATTGSGGTAGSGTGGGGAAPDGGGSEDRGGCSFRVGSGPTSPAGVLGALIALGVVVARRRRARRAGRSWAAGDLR
ncbi:carbohydrate-binding protein [Sorangium cellulosum]|uniref:Carbohydrate-binding protein n=1 Tax=Sorangium cellulosum TaxID=56 RepID=A0A2L0F0V9_SORCE|nr:glycoside hydrolase family 43 protein [Sorangium cellulosum]AUX45166.1 carbohydrate-binding protein [Sorangium cellulosum]